MFSSEFLGAKQTARLNSEVPYGTYVAPIANGKVIEVWRPGKGGAVLPGFQHKNQAIFWRV
jgi:hypothetical protein